MDELIFADGTKADCSFFSVIPERVFVALVDCDEDEMREIFSDKAKTKTMNCGGMEADGYTRLIDVYPQPYGYQAVLEKGD